LAKNRRSIIIDNALNIARDTGSSQVLVFVDIVRECKWFLNAVIDTTVDIIMVLPKSLKIKDTEITCTGIQVIRSWSGNQSRFSRIKYAFLHGVLKGIIQPDSTVVCVLGPSGKNHLDTITIHDLSLSWTEEFPFDVKNMMTNVSFPTVMAVVDIAMDIGALGREGKSIGTSFIVGDSENVLDNSHQAVFNPFKGYPKRERLVNLPEVVESIKELSSLDGSIIITDDGVVEAAGRHLDASSVVTKQLGGLGARHRAAAGMTRKTGSVAVVVSESTGKVTIFEKGRIVATLEPTISRRLV
jgi:DNA integrity scanning protein DisA with diadenylate cyclase activity